MTVSGGHVRCNRAVVSFEARADVARYAGPLVEEFHHTGTDPHLKLLPDETRDYVPRVIAAAIIVTAMGRKRVVRKKGKKK